MNYTLKIVWVIGVLCISQFTQAQQEGRLDKTFITEIGPGGDVNDVLTLTNGNIVGVGGAFSFDKKSRNGTFFVDQNGDLQDLNIFIKTQVGIAKNPITQVLELSNGQMLFVNSFQSTRIHLYNSDGSKDDNFITSGGISGGVFHDAAAQADGKIILVGSFPSFSSAKNSNSLVRINPDGSVDTDFRKDLTIKSGTPYEVEVLKDGKILIGGSNLKIETTTQSLMVGDNFILNSDGSIATFFSHGVVRKMALQSDEKIIIATQEGTGENGKLRIRRIDIDGNIDTSFQTTAVAYGNQDVFINDICIQSDDKILVGGKFLQRGYGGSHQDEHIDSAFYLFRLDKDGKDDASFYPNINKSYHPNGPVNCIEYTPTGDILIGGEFTQIGNETVDHLARLTGDGKGGGKDHVNILQPTSFHFYPNPANTTVNIQCASNFNSWMLTNSLGQRVMHGENERSVFSVSVQGIKSGMYYLSITNSEGTSTQKLWVK